MNDFENLLDTNACLYLLQNKVTKGYVIRNGIISVVSQVELLGCPHISLPDEQLIQAFLDRFVIVPIDDSVLAAATRLRRQYNLGLSDALIAGTAIVRGARLLTHDPIFDEITQLTTGTLTLK